MDVNANPEEEVESSEMDVNANPEETVNSSEMDINANPPEEIEADAFTTKMQIRDKNNESKNDSLLNDMQEICRSKMSTRRALGRIYGDFKSKEASIDFRQSVTELSAREKYDEALLACTKSVAAAPIKSIELGLTYAARSEILFRLKHFKECILDADRAVQNPKCPPEVKEEMRERERGCIIQQQVTGSVSSEEEDRGAVDLRDTNIKRRTVKKYFGKFSWDDSFVDADSSCLAKSSPKIGFKYDESSNTGSIVALEDIRAGEILSVEKFFAVVLADERWYKNCANCLKRCLALIPCRVCTRTMYCSENCRIEAYELYHRTECQMIKFYEYENTDWKVQLAFRALLVGTKQGELLPSLLEELKPGEIFEKAFIPLSLPLQKSYLETLNSLRMIIELTPEKIETLRERLPMIVEAIITLRSLSFYPETNRQTDRLNEMELLCAFLMSLQYMTLERSAYRVMAQKGTEITDECEIGYGAYGIQNFFRYSCNPNVEDYFENRHRKLYAIRPIKKGELLTFSKHHIFAYQPIEERAKINTCSCEACTNQWPLIGEMMDSEIKITAEGASKLLGLILRVREEYEPLDPGRGSGDLSAFISDVIDLLHSHIQQPCYEIVVWEELLVRVMKMFYSDFHKPAEELMKRIDNLIASTKDRLKSKMC